MIDVKPLVVSTLSQILPTYYELFVERDTELPCITYMQNNDEVNIETKEADVSYIRYTIKLWGHSIEELSKYALKVDNAMRDIHFTKYNYNELAMGSQICLIMNYEAMGLETFY